MRKGKLGSANLCAFGTKCSWNTASVPSIVQCCQLRHPQRDVAWFLSLLRLTLMMVLGASRWKYDVVSSGVVGRTQDLGETQHSVSNHEREHVMGYKRRTSVLLTC